MDNGTLATFLPLQLQGVSVDQELIPTIAKDPVLISQLEHAARSLPTAHNLHLGDARSLDFVPNNSLHLVVTSPPYWTLKRYEDDEAQLGHVDDYEEFHVALDKVWAHCLRALVPGGRLVCVVGDVCLSRRQNNGVHTVVPLHSTIQEHCRQLGFMNLAPIIWHKIANVVHEAAGNGAGFLGKPYEPNAVIKNDIEFILMLRKPGGYRQPTSAERLLSIIPSDRYRLWFNQIWTGVTGASTRSHPAPYPIELAERLVRMFSFVGDTVLDPFMGTATTNVASAMWGRNSIGVEINAQYFEQARNRLQRETTSVFASPSIVEHAETADVE